MHKVEVSEKLRGKGERTFDVRVSDAQGESVYEVVLKDVDWNYLTEGKVSREQLVKNSFDFLLEREPRTSILPRFNLMQISDYFPEYVDRIKATL